MRDKVMRFRVSKPEYDSIKGKWAGENISKAIREFLLKGPFHRESNYQLNENSQ